MFSAFLPVLRLIFKAIKNTSFFCYNIVNFFKRSPREDML